MEHIVFVGGGGSFLVLLLLISSFHPEGWFYNDSFMYPRIAEGILETGEYMHKYEDQYLREVERVPGYPLYLALFISLFGNSLLWPLIGQAILGAVTCVVIGLICVEFYKNAFSP